MRCELYIADEISTLPNGKTILVGAYTDKVVVFQVPPAVDDDARMAELPFGVPQLCFMATLIGVAPGKHIASWHIVGPTGNLGKGNQAPTEIQCYEGMSVNLLIKMAPFVAQNFGVCQFVMDVDGEATTTPFELRRVVVAGADMPIPSQMLLPIATPESA